MRLHDTTQPRTRRTITRDPRDKQDAWKLRQIAAGRCPRCGKPCAPFYECETHRANKRREAKRRGELNSTVRLDAVNTFGIEMHNYIADTALSPLEELIRKEDEELGRRGCGAGDRNAAEQGGAGSPNVEAQRRGEEK